MPVNLLNRVPFLLPGKGGSYIVHPYVYMSKMLLYRFGKGIDLRFNGHICRDAKGPGPQLGQCLVQGFLPAPANGYLAAFRQELLGRGQADARRTPGNDRYFICQS